MLEPANGDIDGVEVSGIGLERDPGPRVALTHGPLGFQLAGGLAALVALAKDLAFALYFHLQPFGESVHHGNAHAMQAAGEAVVLVVEFAAGVKAGEDQLHPGNLVLRMDVHGHAAAIVDHLHGAILEQRDLDFPRISGERLVHAVVHHFLDQMVRPGGIGVHPRAAAHGLEPGEHLQRFSGILAGVSHERIGPLQLGLGARPALRLRSDRSSVSG
jgi:hypothetical protein